MAGRILARDGVRIFQGGGRTDTSDASILVSGGARLLLLQDAFDRQRDFDGVADDAR